MQFARIIDESDEVGCRGETVAQFVGSVLRDQPTPANGLSDELVLERAVAIEQMRKRTAHFKIGPYPTREEMNERRPEQDEMTAK